MANIYLDLKDSLQEDPFFYLAAHIAKNDKMRDAYLTCISICPRWSQLHNALKGKKGVSKDNRFLYKKNDKEE